MAEQVHCEATGDLRIDKALALGKAVANNIAKDQIINVDFVPQPIGPNIIYNVLVWWHEPLNQAAAGATTANSDAIRKMRAENEAHMKKVLSECKG